MKLKNKQTGEIIDLDIADIKAQFGAISVIPEPAVLGSPEYVYTSIAELWDEWEDYEDDGLSKIIEWIDKGLEGKELPVSVNDFVEKLKAWHRLKAKGFKFTSYDLFSGSSSQGKTEGEFAIVAECNDFVDNEDLDLLFGDEE